LLEGELFWPPTDPLSIRPECAAKLNEATISGCDLADANNAEETAEPRANTTASESLDALSSDLLALFRSFSARRCGRFNSGSRPLRYRLFSHSNVCHHARALARRVDGIVGLTC
jgi:hypothetical protein